jgi:tRNA(Ile2) C34 agmatinyltransferase TiaS
MNLAERIANLKSSIASMKFQLYDLERQLAHKNRCPHCGRKQISGGDHFGNCPRAKLETKA